MALPVTAASGITNSRLTASVATDGSCVINLELHFRLDAPDKSLSFPVPSNARNITVNGSSARTYTDGGVRHVKLGGIVGNTAGNFTVYLQYTVPGTVEYNEQEKLMLTLPLLSGFSYGVKEFEFTITLPGVLPENFEPTFSSGYYQQSIESSMEFSMEGDKITGKITQDLKDRETLTLLLQVSPDMFHREPVRQQTIGTVEIIMIVLASLAALYWLFFLRCAPFWGKRAATPPEGFTAGEFPCALTGQGADLTMMVLSWAQLGYILIHLQSSGRVILYKRMEMGNERDPYEVRIYKSLFGKKDFVDGTGYAYAALCRKVASAPGNTQDLYRRRNGNPKIFRILCALIGVFSGVSIANGIAGEAVLGFLLIFLLAIFGGISSWVIQGWCKGWHLRNRLALFTSLILCAIWLLLGFSAGNLTIAACAVGAQLLGGLACAYGGRRTMVGRQLASQILGFRRYLRKLTPKDIPQLLRTDPDCFFAMAPYALELGISRRFAKRFGGRKLSACPYLTTGMDGHRTASEWLQLMNRVVSSLDARQQRLPLEQILSLRFF
jgi:hypothetical protein